MSNETPELLDVKLVSPGWMNKYLLTYRLPDGSNVEYESVSRKGLAEYRSRLEANADGRGGRPEKADAVCIVPVLHDDSLLLITGIPVSRERLGDRLSRRTHGTRRDVARMRRP